jgi:hypothetical protein
MATSKRVKWAELDPPLRGELEAILKAHRTRQSSLAARFHSDADELMPFVLLGFLAALGGMIACIYLITSSGSEYEEFGYMQHLTFMIKNPQSLLTSPEGGVIGTALLASALAVFWLRHRGRRGLAITENALVVVRGAAPAGDTADGNRQHRPERPRKTRQAVHGAQAGHEGRPKSGSDRHKGLGGRGSGKDCGASVIPRRHEVDWLQHQESSAPVTGQEFR